MSRRSRFCAAFKVFHSTPGALCHTFVTCNKDTHVHSQALQAVWGIVVCGSEHLGGLWDMHVVQGCCTWAGNKSGGKHCDISAAGASVA